MSENTNPTPKQDLILPPPDMVYIPDLDVKLIVPNPKNPMVMGEKTAELLIENIKVGGFITAITVWKPINQEFYQIIDGEHRWRAMVALGYKTIPVLFAKHITTQIQADYFLLMLNRIKGHFEQDKLGQIIFELDRNLANLSKLTGYDNDLIDAMTRLVNVERIIPENTIDIEETMRGMSMEAIQVADRGELSMKNPLYEDKPTSLFMVNLLTEDFIKLMGIIDRIKIKIEQKDLPSILMKVFEDYANKSE